MSKKVFYDFYKMDKINFLFDALEKCKGVMQKKEQHPEGDVFIHSLQVFFQAKHETQDIDLLMAALLHDVGKIVNSYGHDAIGIKMLNGYISQKTKWLIKNHMRFWDFVLGDMKKQSRVLELRNNKWFPDLVMLARWDKMGRKTGWQPKYNKVEIIGFLKTISHES